MPGGGGGGIGRLLPVGFLFGATDDGATRTMERIQDQVRDTGRATRDAAEQGTTAWTRFTAAIQALSFVRLGGIASTLRDISQRAGAGMQATSIESFGAQFSQTYRAATAGMGQFRGLVDEVRGQISSAAFTYQISAEGMLAATTALARSGARLEDYGLSVRALAGAEQAGALSGENLAGVLTQLSGAYGMGAEGAGQMLDMVTAIGERTGAGVAATAALPDVMTAITDAAGRFPSIGENADVAIESIMRLASATQQMRGGTFQDGVQSAIQVFNELAATRGEMQALITGLGTEFPDLAREIGISSGDIDASMAAVMQDPLRFAQSMQTLFAEGRNGQMMSDRLTQALGRMGPQFLQVVHGGDAARESLAAAAGTIDNVGGAYTRMASSAAGSTRTFGESMELLGERFRTQVNTMLRSMPGYQNFEQRVLRRQGEAYQWLGGVVRWAASRSGPFGAFSRTMLAMRRGGVAGLTVAIQQELGGAFPRLTNAIMSTIPALEGLGDALWQGVVAAGPFVRLMSDFGIVGGTAAASANGLSGAIRKVGAAIWGAVRAAGPWVLIIGALVTAGYLLYRYWDRIPELWNRAGAALEGLATRGRDISRTFINWVTSIDWAQATSDLVTGFFRAIGDAFVRQAGGGGTAGAGGQGGRIMTALGEMFVNFFQGIRRMTSGIVAGLIQGLFSAVGLPNMGRLFGDIYRFLIGLQERLMQFELGGLGRAMQWLGAIFGPIFRQAGEALNQIGAAWSDIWADLEPMIADFMFGMDELSAEIDRIFNEIIVPAVEPFITMFAEDIIGGILPQTEEGVVDVGNTMRTIWRERVQPALRSFLGNWIRSFGDAFANTIRGFIAVQSFGIRAFSRINVEVEILRRTWQNVTDLMRAGWEGIQAVSTDVWTRISVFVRSTFDDIIDSWRMGIVNLRNFLVEGVRDIISSIDRLVQALPERARSALGLSGISASLTEVRQQVETTALAGQRELAGLRAAQVERHRQEQAELVRSEQARRAAEARMATTFMHTMGDPASMRAAASREAEAQVAALTAEGSLYSELNRGARAFSAAGEAFGEQVESGVAGERRRAAALQPVTEAIAGRGTGLTRRQREQLEAAIAEQVGAEGTMGLDPAVAQRIAEGLRGRRGRPVNRRQMESLVAQIRGEEAPPEPPAARRRRLGGATAATVTGPAPTGTPTNPVTVQVTPDSAREIGRQVDQQASPTVLDFSQARQALPTASPSGSAVEGAVR